MVGQFDVSLGIELESFFHHLNKQSNDLSTISGNLTSNEYLWIASENSVWKIQLIKDLFWLDS